VRRVSLTLLLVPIVLAAVFWFRPPRGDDSYHHTINAVEQVRAWREGAVFPRYHRGWNGGTGTFVPSIYSPIPLLIQGGLAWITGDGQRAVGLSLAIALLVLAVALAGWTGRPAALWVALAPYPLAVAVSRSTTTEAWALAGAAIVLPLAMPPAPMTPWRGVGLASGTFLVAGCQVGMLLQLGWLLGVSWMVYVLVAMRGAGPELSSKGRELVGAVSWSAAGLATAGILWVPAVLDAKYLAIGELTSGPLDWRNNFLPSSGELGIFLTATAASLMVLGCVVLSKGERTTRLSLVAAIVVGVILSTRLSAPLWHLPKMEILQFPWRTLGPTTLVAVMAIACLRDWWRAVGVVVLLLPLVLLPLRVGSGADSVPTNSTPEELAMIAHHQWGLASVLPTTAGLYAPGYHRLESLDHLARQQAWIEVVDRNATGGEWRVTHKIPGMVLLPLQWWPEWHIEVSGFDTEYTNRHGLVAVETGPGAVNIRASLAPSRSRRLGKILSICGFAALVLLMVERLNRDRKSPAHGGTS
jgi:hypothetical protein